MSKNIFQRTEKKYKLTQDQYQAFLAKTKSFITEDQFGLHTISNIYYDTTNYELIRHSIEKPKYKEKFRVRAYGTVSEQSPVFLEIKKKVNGVVYKRRVSLLHKQAKRYLEKRIVPDSGNQIIREINYLFQFYEPVPKLYLAYDRTAYIGSDDPQLRITIDQNIRSRDYDLDLTLGDYGSKLDEDFYLMEIKVDLAYPVWLARVLSELQIYPVSFSKYGTVYKENIKNESEEVLCSPAYLAV